MKGEADHSAAEVADALESGQSLRDVAGLVLNENGKQVETGSRPLLDMNTLPLPARDLVKRYRPQYFNRGYRPIVTINSSRGCPHRCSFCVQWKLNGGKYRMRSAELVVDEIEQLEENFIDFVDDNSLADVSRAHRIADLLLERGIKKTMRMYGRADTVAENPELIAKLAKAGLKLLLVGFEAVQDTRLDELNKKCDLDKNRRAIKILQENNVQIASYFLVDPKFETADFDALWNYVDEMNLSEPIFSILVPFPGSDLYEQVKNDIHYTDPRLFDFFHTVFETKLPLDEFYRQYELLYKRSYDDKRQRALTPAGVPEEVLEARAQGFAKIMSRIELLKTHHNSQISGNRKVSKLAATLKCTNAPATKKALAESL